MKDIKITLTDTSEFVLISRNSDNSKFYIRPKSDIIRENEGQKTSKYFMVISSTYKGVIYENKIIQMINNGVKIYTMDGDEFTEVFVVDGNLKSISNNTDMDNIVKLPITIEE